MAQHPSNSQRTITATELRRNLSMIIRRLRRRREHTVIKRSGAPVAVILSMSEYEKLTKRRAAKAAFDDFARNLGREVEKSGLTEEQLLEELEETKREVFEERYGKIR